MCAKCSANHAIDREEPLFRLLGPELGPLYYYTLKRFGFADLDHMKGDQFDQAYVKAEVEITPCHRAEVLRRLKEYAELTGAALGMSIRSTVMAMTSPDLSIAAAGLGTSLNTNGGAPQMSAAARFGVSPPPAFDSECAPGSSYTGDVGTPYRGPSSVVTGESPRTRASYGSVFQCAADVASSAAAAADRKLTKKKWTDEVSQMEVERNRLRSQLQVLDASIGTQRQTLTRLKQLTDEEEGRQGKLTQLSEQLFSMKTEARMVEELEVRRKDEIKAASEAAMQEVKKRRAEFQKKTHKSPTCMLCLKSFTLFDREHHCRVCFRSCCDVCSKTRSKEGARSCDWCHAHATMKSPAWAREARDSREFRLLNRAALTDFLDVVTKCDQRLNVTQNLLEGMHDGNNASFAESDGSSDPDKSPLDHATDAKIAAMIKNGQI